LESPLADAGRRPLGNPVVGDLGRRRAVLLNAPIARTWTSRLQANARLVVRWATAPLGVGVSWTNGDSRGKPGGILLSCNLSNRTYW
jgi:hypothetical protein